ncbi:MAG: hypothetical protein EZS28_019062, partial [Streblomastix strix]
MHFVLLLAVTAILCKDFVPPLHVRQAELGSAFKGNNTNILAPYALSSQSELTPLKSTNDACKWNVGKSVSGDNSKQKVQNVLDLSSCDGYEIILVDSEHFESVIINKTDEYTVLIKGGAQDEEGNKILTVWGVNTLEPRIITLLQGNLTLQNFEFKYYQSSADPEDDQDETIWLWNAIIIAYEE